MKIFIFISLAAFFAITSGVFVPPRPGHKKHLLGEKECTHGPGYWCQNLTNAAGCHAVKHCIQTVWVHKQLPPDTSNVCQICLDMVKQARDQLESNETQELIKEVFEGSCALIHLKPIVKECDKIADEFIPELIETLASEMNPQVVCSVAGLCNNARIQRMLEEAEEAVTTVENKPTSCENCHTVVDLIEQKFNKMSRDDVLQSFLEVCGNLGSFSDACSNIIVTYFTDIYNHLQENLNSNEVCLMSGECSAQFHTHAKVEVIPMSHIGFVPVNNVEEDLPCELCEQLVDHLKDLLISNTTEEEFKMVLKGLCKQTKSFAQECVDLVEQYYGALYNFLVKGLNSTQACQAVGICNKSSKYEGGLIAPLLPAETADLAVVITPATKKPLVHINLSKDTSSVKVISPLEQQLPIDLLMPPHTQVLYNDEICAFCEYFLHYVQEALTEPKTEEKIKQVIEKACTILPNSVNDTCVNFVDTYEPALVAIFAQEIDPSQVCPLIKACPSSTDRDVEIFMKAKRDSKCPLCLIAITKLESMVKDKSSKESIKAALDKLCVNLPNTLKDECEDFVSTYTDEVIELIIYDLKPQEVCVYLKCCTDDRPASTLPPYVDRIVITGDIETNIIPDNTINGEPIEELPIKKDSQCVLCEFIMRELQTQLKNKKTDEEIRKVVLNICDIMPSSIAKQCDDFVNEYAETIIRLLIEALEPSEICTMMKLCKQNLEVIKVEILDCPLCQMIVDAMEKILSNPKVDHDIQHVLEKTCRGLPKHYRRKCVAVIDKYGEQIIDLLIHYTDKNVVCHTIGLCKSALQQVVID